VSRNLKPRSMGIPSERKSFSALRRDSSTEDPKKIEELVREVEFHCPVLDTLLRPIPMRGKPRFNGNKLEI
jgi:hypothetical protein